MAYRVGPLLSSSSIVPRCCTALRSAWRRRGGSGARLPAGVAHCSGNGEGSIIAHRTMFGAPGTLCGWEGGACARWNLQASDSVGVMTIERLYFSKSGASSQERKMIDKFRLHVKGGNGGAGCSSFRKGRQSRHGFADGGNGGRGGDVILISSMAEWDFGNLQHHLNGMRGGQGSSKKRVGSRGVDKIVQVPVGTVIHLVQGSIPSLGQISQSSGVTSLEDDWDSSDVQEKSNAQSFIRVEQAKVAEGLNGDVELTDLANRSVQDSDVETFSDPRPQLLDAEENLAEDARTQDWSTTDDEKEEGWQEQVMINSIAEFIDVGQSVIVASGGSGGKGNAAMARGRGSDKGLPSLEHEQGEVGSEANLILELKTIADVGLVGAPNAGKSTLLGSLSMAKPRTGHYKFTTLRPNIGMLKYEDYFSLTVADIPGLIDGAHDNRGLGHTFLRHIERTKALAYVIDLAGGIGDDTGPLPWDQFRELVFELEQYQEGLSQRPAIVVSNKIDEEGAIAALQVLREKIPFLEIFPVCAVLEEGVDVLKLGLRNLVESLQVASLPLSPPREL